MNLSNFDLLAAVSEITKNHHKSKVLHALIEQLDKLFECESVSLHKITNRGEGPLECLVKKTKGLNLELLPCASRADIFVKQCIESQQTIVHANAGSLPSRILIPIWVGKHAHAVISLFLRQPQQETIELIQQLSEISANLLNTIHESEVDTLTGLLNRKTLELQLDELFYEQQDDDSDTHEADWLVILDIDKFKSINDIYGHTFGDEVLLLFSNLMKQNFRSSDLIFRYGGEEFVVIIRSADEKYLGMILNRVKQAIQSYPFPQVGQVTTSMGAAVINPKLDPNTVLEQADKALYFCKENGRNQFAIYHQLIDSKLIESAELTTDIELF